MSPGKINVLVCGIGEYVTGYVPGQTNISDKSMGVVGLVLMDIRQRGKVDWIGMVGTTGKKHAEIREHIQKGLGKYKGLDTSVDLFPPDDVERDAEAYKEVMDGMEPGDAVIVFTPDDTHYEICFYAIQKGLHVLCTIPIIKTLAEHKTRVEEARENGVHVQIERTGKGPTYGDFSYFNSYMSQPKYQLNTFRSWAGKSSDISYYLNSHHVDICTWFAEGIAKPVKLAASASTGVATSEPHNFVEGTG
ncbi:hypothetical protein BJ742DRAFT_769317 [Cladochytrium replicatum]|nr:hypothetical protein BJ742DRAFT_769317 [Cladochytrium replicatum]